MKITIYELLGMIKDGIAPKTIKSEGHYYHYNELEKDYYEGMGYDYEYLLANTSIKELYDEIEIIEDIPKEEKIPMKIYWDIGDNTYTTTIFNKDYKGNKHNFKELSDMYRQKINEIIDYLEYLKSKGE